MADQYQPYYGGLDASKAPPLEIDITGAAGQESPSMGSSIASGAAAGTAIMPGWGTLIGAGAGLLGGILSNKSNAKSAAASMAASAAEAEKNRAWQERMSGTSHQREIEDLRLAGLNPILSGTGGMGASTPHGGAGTGATYQSQNIGEAAVSSAVGLGRNMEEVNNMRVQYEIAARQMQNVEADTAQKRAAALNYAAMTERNYYEGQLARWAETGAKTESDIDSSDYGKAIRWMMRGIEAGEGASSALRNMFPWTGLFSSGKAPKLGNSPGKVPGR